MAHLTNFSFEFFRIFTEDVSLLLLYHHAKKWKMTKNSNQGGCLNRHKSWINMLLTWPVSGRDGQVQYLSVWSSSVLREDLFLSRINRLPFALLKVKTKWSWAFPKKELFCNRHWVQSWSHGERGHLSYIVNMNWSVTGLTRWHLLLLFLQRNLAKFMPERCAMVKNCQTLYWDLNPIVMVNTYFPVANPLQGLPVPH